MTYTSSFQDSEHAAYYDSQVYAEGSYSSFIWGLQQPVLKRIIETHRPRNALDFACGTGRILSFVERLVPDAVGVDTSAEMSDIARSKCNTAVIRTGELGAISELQNTEFDLITCFRFILNAEPSLRLEILRRLQSHLSQDGILVANIHGNAHSLRHLGLMYRKKLRDEVHCEMTRGEVRELFAASGFRIVEEHGFGFVPQRLHRGVLLPVARGIDRALRHVPVASGSIDLLYVCRKA